MTAVALPPALSSVADSRRLTQAERKRAALKDGVFVPAEVEDEKYFIPSAPERRDLGHLPHLAYLRKSSEDQQKQTLSLKAQRQHAEAAAKGPLPLTWWESFSGTTFEGRPAFKALLAFCKANPQPPEAMGVIWAWDYDRFSRQQLVVDGKKKPHTKAMLKMLLEFDEAGWRWHFIKTPPMGYELGDMIIGLVKFEQAGQYSSSNSENVQRNKDIKALDETEGGFWVGGTPPYPAVRVDFVTGRVMGTREWTQPEHGVVLQRDDALYPYWELAARLVADDGWSPQRVADHLNSVSAPLGPTMVEWHERVIKRMLTNTALISLPVYQKHKGGQVYQARWKPIVDEQLFHRAKATLEARSRAKARPRSYGNPRPLTACCPQCGAEFTHRTLTNGRRVYTHPAPRGAKSAEWRQRAIQAGCKSYSFDAVEAEEKVFALIQQERMSETWLEEMRKEFERQGEKESHAFQLEEQARSRYDQAKREYEQLLANLAVITDPYLLQDFQQTMRTKKAAIEERKLDWEQARKASTQVDTSWADVERRVSELSQLCAAWEVGDLRTRSVIFRNWVEHIDVFPTALPEPAAGRRRTRQPKGLRFGKQLAVFLRHRPEAHTWIALTYGPTKEFKRGNMMVNGSTSGSQSTEHHPTQFWVDLSMGYNRKAA